MRMWRPWPAGWQPDRRTVGLVVLVLFLVSAVDTLLFSDGELSGAFAGHPPGLSSAEASALSLFPVNDRVIDGLAFLAGILSVVAALGGVAMVRGLRRAGTVVAAAAGSIILIDLVSVFLHTPPVRALVSVSLNMAVLLVVLISVLGWNTTAARWTEARSYLVALWSSSLSSPTDGGDRPDEDATTRATIESIWPGSTKPTADDNPTRR